MPTGTPTEISQIAISSANIIANLPLECFDKDGGQLHPSGFIGEEFPAAQTTEPPVVMISSDPASQTTPIINLETGTEVTFNFCYLGYSTRS